MAIPIDQDSQNALNADKLMEIKRLLKKTRDFVEQVYIPDLLAIASFYKDWDAIGGQVGARQKPKIKGKGTGKRRIRAMN